MLTHLQIKNFTLIPELSLEFFPGMTTLTGETGAGKSIILDALGLVLGDRADSKVIRQGADRCDITALFDIKEKPELQQWLIDHAIDSESECILQRIISRDSGRSRHLINGHAVPLQLMRELGSQLINIHGQHEHYSLLEKDEQRKLLDHYGAHESTLKEIAELYHRWHHIQQEYHQLKSSHDHNTARAELLQYQIQELDALALGENEVTSLENEYKKLANADTLLTRCQTALHALSENEDASALKALNQAQHALAPHSNIDPKIANAITLLNQALIQTQEATDEIRGFLDHFELNPERLRALEERLQTIYELARKHKVSPEKLFELHAALKTELHQIVHSDERLESLNQELSVLEKNYLTLSEKLTAARKNAAKKLSLQVMENLQALGMGGCVFAIKITPPANNTLSPHGLDHIEFEVATNPGLPPGPLNKIASGGELSRIGLAIQVVTSQKIDTPTLIFDEVDAGVGGKTAAIIGQLLRSLCPAAQVMCVTHLPQVAAFAHHHLSVEKNTAHDVTQTYVKLLTPEERAQEIARMLGGIKITQQTLAHAKEMLENSMN